MAVENESRAEVYDIVFEISEILRKVRDPYMHASHYIALIPLRIGMYITSEIIKCSQMQHN